MELKRTCVCWFLLLIIVAKAYKICFISFPWIGHIDTFQVLAYEMAERGHNITIALPDEFAHLIPKHDNIHFLGTGPFVYSEKELEEAITKVTRSPYCKARDTIKPMLHQLNQALMSFYPILQKEENKPDLIIHVPGTYSATDLALALGIPHVLYQPSSLFEPFFTQFYGHRLEPAYVPAHGAFLPVEMNFIQRVKNTMVSIVLRTQSEYDLRHWRNRFREQLGLEPLQQGDSTFPLLVICAQSWGFIPAHPVSPLVKLVGPMLPPPTQEPLTEDLIQWFDSSEQGVVVVSLESVSRFDPEIIHYIIDALGRIPRRVLWVLRDDDPLDHFGQLPPNIFTCQIASHFSLLAHPKVQVFFFAGGIARLSEGLWHSVPELCLGAHPEQGENCLALERTGAGLALYKESVTTEEIFTKLMRILEDEKFKENAALVSRIYHTDQGPKQASILIENALSVNQPERLIPYGTKLPWWQLQLIDVLAFIFTVGLCFISLAACCFWKLCSYCWNRSSRDNLVSRTLQKCKND